VRKWIDFAVELGKVICIPDPEAAAQRDREMLAAQAQPDFRAPPTPSPRLGPGLWLEDAPGSGILGPQGLVERNGRRGLFDDLVGVRFAVITRSPAILGEISEVNGKALELLGAAIVHFDESAGGLKDVEGTYHRFLDGLGCEAMLVRPDFYLQGTARNAAELNRLLDVSRSRLFGAGHAADNMTHNKAFASQPRDRCGTPGVRAATRGLSHKPGWNEPS